MEHLEQDRLQAYLDGALPPGEARVARAHLDACPACRAELALLREADAALRAWPVLPAPEGLAARVMAQVGLEARNVSPSPSLRATPWLRTAQWLRRHWSEALLAAVLVATIAVLVVSGRALGGQDLAGLRFWGLQAQRALAALERAWYQVRAGRAVRADAVRPYAVQVYCWVAGVIALLAAAASAVVLAQPWRRFDRSAKPVVP